MVITDFQKRPARGIMATAVSAGGTEHQPIMEQWGLREKRPPQPLIPVRANDQGGMYFEVYHVPEVLLTAILRGGGEWRWRFCSADGCVEATSGAYVSQADCVSAIDMLRSGATTADLHLPEIV